VPSRFTVSLVATISRSFEKVGIMSNRVIFARSSFIGRLVGWFIRIVIYDICITTIQQVFGVSRFMALIIFLGILAAISFGGYLMKQKMSPGVEDDY
jgi:hypothetical protein